MILVEAHGLVLRDVRLERIDAVAHHHEQADAKLAVRRESLDHVDAAERLARIVERRHALLEARLHGELELTIRVGIAFGGALRLPPLLERAVREPRCGFAQQADRPAGRILQDLTARRIHRRARDVGKLHRLGVHERRVAAGVRQHHRVVLRHFAQCIVVREALDVRLGHTAPLFLVPTAAKDPLTRLRLLRGRRDHRHDLVPVLDVHQIERQLRLSKSHEVSVAFD